MPSKSASVSMTTVPSSSRNAELGTSLQPKKTQLIFVQRSPKFIISHNACETVRHFILTQQPIVNISDVSVAPVPTGATGSASNDTVIIDTSSNTTIDTFDQSGSATTSTNHHRQSFGDEVTYVTNSSNLSVPEITTTTATTTLKTTTVAATTQVGFLTSEAEGNVETVVVPSSDISGSDETQQLSLMDAYPIGQVTSTNDTYVYTNEYPPYYQYQPIHSPTQQTYVIQQQGSPGSVEEDVGAQLGHTTRASPATIQWLINNYEPADGTSLPRCTLYSHYIKHCNENKLEPVNAASFGKLIRSVFHGLRTRRLGTRGNSKYHYYGIRIKPDSPLNRGSSATMALGEDYNRTPLISSAQSVNQLPSRSSSRRSTLGSNSVITRRTNSMETDTTLSQSANSRSSPPSAYEQNVSSNHGTFSTYRNQDANSSIGMDREVLGEGEVPHVSIPDMQGLESYLQPLGLTLQHAVRFIDSYTTNCAEVLECIKQLHFDMVEECWITFWQPENDQEDMEDEDCNSNDKTLKGLSQIQLFRLCTVPEMQAFVQNMDFSFYQVIVEVLIPDVLSSNISGALTLQIRNFAKSLEMQLKKAMQGAPDVIQKKKLVAVRTLAQTLRRYTSLNHLASAARGVLQKPDQIHQMLQDFNRVDIASVQDQAGWVCDCDPVLVSNLQSDFRENLQKQKSLEQWADWMEAVVDQILAKYHDKPYGVLADVSKQFLRNWSFYSSMIIRDLTLRSAQSFGSFHLIRLLFDEYLLYLVELRLAKASNKPVIYVMTQVMENIALSETNTVGAGMGILASQPIVASNGVGLLPTNTSSHFFSSLETDPGVNIVYMDERSGETQTIHYVSVGSNTPPHMDTLEQIVQSSEMTLEDVKNDLDDGERKDLNLI